MTQSIVCSACGASVPYGRLSCPECGEMLASVAGMRRGDPVPAAAGGPVPDVLHDADDGPTAAAAGRSAAPAPPPIIVSGAATWAADADGYGALLTETAGPPPGAYVPPAPVGEPAIAGTAAAATFPAGPPAPARAWAGHAPSGTAAPDAAEGAGTAGSASVGPMALPAGERAGEFVRWLAIAGSALAAAGMILPWSGVSVIGASGIGYFDRWGLAGPGHLLVTVLVLLVLAAALLRDRVPAWLGVGLPGLAVGGLLVGLTWPYLIGPLDGQLGAVAVALGGALLVAAGIAALVVDRHARGEPVV